MLTKRHSRGFTLIEILVALVIIALMVLVSLPSMTTYFQNSKIGTAAQSYAAGMQVARTEAIRRNLPVDFILTDTDVATADIANVVAPSPTGRNWVVRVFDTPAATFRLIETKSALEGSGQIAGSVPAVAVTGSAVLPPAAFSGMVAFNGFGGTTITSEIQLDINNLAGGACGPAGPMRCLRVRAAPGGLVRVCDPQLPIGDSRSCF
jgi:type IV fimbrial biogenesis protein FimT